MSGGGGQATASPLDVDQTQLQAFLKTDAGAQYSANYNPNYSYAQVGDSIQAYDPRQNIEGATRVGNDVSGMISAFNNWVAGNQQTQTNWANYAAVVGANEGGQGDNTITSGAAMGQRQMLLGALANAGQPTAPTPGLGSMGASK